MPVKPIDFGSQAPKPTTVAREPAPIKFDDNSLESSQRKRAQAIVDRELAEAKMWADLESSAPKHAQELEFKVNPQTFMLEAVPVDPHDKAARKAAELMRAKPIEFTAPTITKPAAHVPQAAFGVTEHPAYAQIIAKIKSDHAQIYAANEFKIKNGVTTLLPLKVETILDWGQKAMERVRDASNEATRMSRLFSNAEGNELCEKALEATRATGAARFFRIAADPLKFRPQLAALQSSLTTWLPQCNTLIDSAKAAHNKLMSLLVVMNVTADIVGTSDDLDVDRVLTQRRTMITQSTMQADLTVKQLEQLRDQIINQRMQIDQLVNVTLPAYEAAKR